MRGDARATHVEGHAENARYASCAFAGANFDDPSQLSHHHLAMAYHTLHCRAVYSGLAAAFLLLAAGGCSSAPDPDNALDSMRSWAVTARFTAAELRRGAVTATYTAEIRDVASKALDGTRRQLAQGAFSPEATARLVPAADSLATAVRQLDAAFHAP